MQLMQKDKKVKQGAVVIVGLDRLGNAVVCEDFSLELIEAELEKMA